ncbi:MAG: ADP-ribosylglycohydrolase family protein, partial [Clostridia bacterium]|nr:ADP-ribosylglycohydrolase family protein [Clostridia bacterium]
MGKTVDYSPDYASMDGWEVYSKNLAIEYEQSVDEGLDVERYKKLFDAVAELPDGAEKERLSDVIFDMVSESGVKEGYTYTEPSDLEGIRALRDGRSVTAPAPRADVLEDKISGAWLGRICGCLLGKPVEGVTSDYLVPFLMRTGNYPMRRYIVSPDVTDSDDMADRVIREHSCCADAICCAPSDDDTNYTVISQKLIEKYGRGFTTSDVGQTWIALQPKGAYCTAERVAFCNLVRGIRPPKTATYKNAYREWIGAQIRADYYG